MRYFLVSLCILLFAIAVMIAALEIGSKFGPDFRFSQGPWYFSAMFFLSAVSGAYASMRIVGQFFSLFRSK